MHDIHIFSVYYFTFIQIEPRLTLLTIQFFLWSLSGVAKPRCDILKDHCIIRKLGYSLISLFFSSLTEKVCRTALKSCPCRTSWWLFPVLKSAHGNLPYAFCPFTRFQSIKGPIFQPRDNLYFLTGLFFFLFIVFHGIPFICVSLTSS